MNNLASADEVLAAAKQRWDDSDCPDAAQFVRENPTLKNSRSIVMELAYEEYFRRTSSGENLNAMAFCNRFSICKHSLQRRIEVHDFLHNDEDFWFESEQWPEAGETFGDFLLQQQLGSGVASRVFLARQKSLSDRLVVLKLSHSGYREAQILSTLEHSNIVPILSVEEHDESGLVAICMPYLTPWTLTDFLDAAYGEGKAPDRFGDALARLQANPSFELPTIEEANESETLLKCSYVDGVLYLMRQIAEALRHTHERGILHLDLKPSNILITGSGKPYLLDFNLSADVSSKKAYGGTLPYMPPEQLEFCFKKQQSGASVTCRTDVYSLGAVTYQLLAGSLPFEVEPEDRSTQSAARQLRELQRVKHPNLRAKCRYLDGRTEKLITQCLVTDPDRRPTSMAETASRYQQSLSAGSRIHRLCRKRAATLALLAAVVLGILLGGAHAVATSDPRDVRHFDDGAKHLELGESEFAITAFSKAIEINPKEDEYWHARGRARQQKGDLNGAIEDYTKSLTIDPQKEDHARIAQCLALQVRRPEAIVHFEKAKSMGLDTPGLHACLGRCYLANNDYIAAIDAFKAIEVLDPNSWRMHYGVALAETRMATTAGNPVPHRAITHIDRASDLNPGSWTVAMAAAHVHYEYARSFKPPLEFHDAIGHLHRSIMLDAPQSAVESFRSLPELEKVPRFRGLVEGYVPSQRPPPSDLKYPDPVLE